MSTEEKAIVSRVLTEKSGFRHSLVAFLPYLLPVSILSIYGIVQKEYVACALAFFALVSMAIWYIYQAESSSIQLRSALHKYESELRALGGDHETT